MTLSRDMHQALSVIDDHCHTIINQNKEILKILTQLTTEETNIMATLADVQAKVAAVGTVEDSAVALLTALVAKIQELIDSGADPAAFQKLVDDLTLHTDPLAAAVAANTPSG